MASRKDEKGEGGARSDTNNASTGNSLLQQQQEAVGRSIDGTKDNIRVAIEEARQEIPKYSQVVRDYQNETIDASREIAESYLDSQKQIINTMQSAWDQNMNQMQKWWSWQMVSPQAMADMYTRMASGIADATISAARVANNMLFANMEAARTSMNYARDNAREAARLTADLTGSFEGDYGSQPNSGQRGEQGQEEGRRRQK
jgi:inorganic triphosphatase YgiF